MHTASACGLKPGLRSEKWSLIKMRRTTYNNGSYVDCGHIDSSSAFCMCVISIKSSTLGCSSQVTE